MSWTLLLPRNSFWAETDRDWKSEESSKFIRHCESDLNNIKHWFTDSLISYWLLHFYANCAALNSLKSKNEKLQLWLPELYREKYGITFSNITVISTVDFTVNVTKYSVSVHICLSFKTFFSLTQRALKMVTLWNSKSSEKLRAHENEVWSSFVWTIRIILVALVFINNQVKQSVCCRCCWALCIRNTDFSAMLLEMQRPSYCNVPLLYMKYSRSWINHWTGWIAVVMWSVMIAC